MQVTPAYKYERLTIYWDGQCPFCSAIRQKIKTFDTTQRLNFVDMNDPEIAATAQPRFSPADLDREMHVLLPDGTWRTGFFAVTAMLRILPAWSWAGVLMQSWALADLGPKVYRWVAQRRYFISRIFSLPPPCDNTGSCRVH